MWISLLEKAMAKMHGRYECIEAGQLITGLRAVTGAPAVYHDHEKTQDLFGKIMEAEQRNWIMTTQTKSTGEHITSDGFVLGHAYSVLSAKVINNKGKQVQLIKVRNPWGNTEWKGDWSDKSPLWTDDLKSQCGWEDKDDGQFWITIADYTKNFSGTAIAYVEDLHENKVV